MKQIDSLEKDISRKAKKHNSSGLDAELMPVDLDQLTEARARFVMNLKCLYQHHYDKYQCSGQGILSLVSSANIDYDKTESQMTSWDSIH